jgi:multidrug efflux pump subunit AcrA (membrane-fusion protein)
MKKTIGLILGLAVVGFIVYRVFVAIEAKQAVNEQAAESKITPVEVTRPSMSSIVDRILQPGTISAHAEVTLYSKVAGKLERNLVEMNDNVKPAQVVSLVDRDEVGYTYNLYEVKSNAKGTIARVLQNPGAVISPNTPLYLVVDIDSVKAVIQVPESQIRFVRLKHQASVLAQAYPSQQFTGRVSNLSPVANPASRTIDVEISIANPRHMLKPGMFVQAELVLQKRTAMVVPLASVTEREGRKVVFVALDSVAEMKSVTTGTAVGDAVEITDGLRLADLVVKTGTHLLNNRDRIRVVNQE